MISGVFHPAGQEWRYYSREKALIHTLHLAQIPTPRNGESVFITPVPPTGTAGSNFSVPPLSFPSLTPFGGFNWTQVTNNIPPLWMELDDPGLLPSMNSGQYGNWSGVAFNGLLPGLQRLHVGAYFLPMTGGTYWYEGDISVTHSVGAAGSVVTTDETCDLALKLFPLEYDSNGTNGSPTPPDYADTYYPWKVTSYLSGDGWGGSQFMHDAGNAVSTVPQTIAPTRPYLTWLGQHILLNVANGANVPRAISMRLGP